MACCQPNLPTSKVLFSFLTWRNHYFGTFFFLQPLRKHYDQSAFKKVLNPDRRFRPASQTKETKMVMHISTAKLNSTFGTIGKATAVKRLLKWSVETQAVALV